MLATRLATAAVGIPLVVLVIWVGSGWLAGLVGVAVFIAVLEIALARMDGSSAGPMQLVEVPGRIRFNVPRGSKSESTGSDLDGRGAAALLSAALAA
ncbi:MAG TPA: hypothetical protein VJB57_13505, partial [Dehalococcoidia bacterium]|nr:hypothetical protein [Dehalococcoidia bacterium]